VGGREVLDSNTVPCCEGFGVFYLFIYFLIVKESVLLLLAGYFPFPFIVFRSGKGADMIPSSVLEYLSLFGSLEYSKIRKCSSG